MFRGAGLALRNRQARGALFWWVLAPPKSRAKLGPESRRRGPFGGFRVICPRCFSRRGSGTCWRARSRRTSLTGAGVKRQSATSRRSFNAHARAIFDPRQGMRIDGENRSRPWQQGNMEANGSEVAQVRADRGQSDFSSAPGKRLKLASKTGVSVAAEPAQFGHIVDHVLVARARDQARLCDVPPGSPTMTRCASQGGPDRLA
jgi:hypothetical protein